MLASQLKEGDWIRPTMCAANHQLGPSKVVLIFPRHEPPYVEVHQLFDAPTTHSVYFDSEVELC